MSWTGVGLPPLSRSLCDPLGKRHAAAGHPVEDVAGGFGLGLLIGQSPSVTSPADEVASWMMWKLPV